MPSRALFFSADANAVAVLKQVLADMEIAGEECRDSAECQAKVHSARYEVIVIDSPDPAVSDALLQQARLSATNKNTLLINLVDAQSSVKNAFRLGANFVLYRPLSVERARASLRAASHLIRREKRRSPRAPVHSQATISYPTVENAPATLVDLSEDGLAIQCDRRLPAKSKVYFRFTLPGQMKWIQLSGDTVWQDSTGRAGIRFVDVPAGARRLLQEWLSSKASFEESKVTVQLAVGQPGRLSNSPADRRIQSRHSCHLGAEIFRAGSSVPHRCSLTDISVGGCYIEMPSPFEVGEKVEMTVRTQAFKFQSRGVVQTVNPGFGMGVAFLAQSEQQREQVQHLIKIVFRDRAADSDPVLRF
jgi:DNA-binding NarL/FixJ family response regulator